MTFARCGEFFDGGMARAGRRNRFQPSYASAAALVMLLALSAGMAGSAVAQETAWEEGHASRARLIAGAGDGTQLLAGIEIELTEGYKTYWRHAGDSGLPPEIDWSGSRNVADLSLEFPAPGRFRDASGTFFGYQDEVLLPVMITPTDTGEPVTLSVSLSYGVCKDVCIPAFADFELTIPVAQSGSHAPRLADASRQVPRRVTPGEPYAGLAFHDHDLTDDGKLALTVEAPPDALLMAEGPDYHWFLDPDEAARPDSSGRQVFTVDFAETPREITGATPFRFTLVGDGAAIETLIEIPQEALRTLAGH
ncbi:MAG: suppressor for copper-sensitivity B [Saliniramus fredricksonii]|uniref:Suppressor for copper-sensitivity B n=1 Tax=Saliniramus fredricksonii TaxID=1653334 RepID=A0A0P7X6T9_9HYPH|nr:protein-disulfide reductase DsbD domain-containing protein [Saliniramus fredricksonii]KPQ10764.1 MAG: suppressor for copper-sensitivity B [Saliniramus fredricksonii]SCC79531.1 Thiol-disulfide interchange protein, contains DsbC and DsbD domains [Saliniramus fredricksonii]